MQSKDVSPADYQQWVNQLKQDILQARTKAALSVNREMVLLYWRIGQSILEKQEKLGWGAKVIEKLSQDLCREFPEMKGFSLRNCKYMRSFAEAYPDEQFVQQVAAQI